MTDKTIEQTLDLPPEEGEEQGNEVRLTVESGVGERLRKAREAQFKSREDIARELHVRTAYVHAIEAEDYDRLPEVIYTRGYIRNYARLVGLPADELLTQLDQIQATGSPQVRARTTSVEDFHKGDSWARWLAYLLLAVALGLGGVWVYEYFVTGESRTLGMGDAVTPGAEQSVEQASQPEPVTPDTAGASAAGLSEAEARERLRQGLVERPTEEPAVAGPMVVDAPTAAVNGAALEDVSETAVATPSAELPEGHVRLHAAFEERSWVEIYDAEGERLIYDNLSHGEDFQVAGMPPFRIVLGNPAGVRIEVDGDAYDMSHIDPTGVARFQVPGTDGR